MSNFDLPAWPPERAGLHVLQGIAEPIDQWVESVTLGGGPSLTKLVEVAADGYCAAFVGSELVEFDDRGATSLFDLADDPGVGRTPRVVAAWGHSSAPTSPRNRSRQAGFRLSAMLIAQGYERGHLLANASGGGLDENLFAQARQVNEGLSEGGRAYRKLERMAARQPGSLMFHRLIYGGSDIPDLTQFTVGLSASTHTGAFDNRPYPVSPNRLLRGQQFHRRVQTAFLSNLVGASGHPEHTLALRTGARRVDLLILPETEGEVTAVVVEVKNTDWDAIRAVRVRPNLRRHIRQLQEYLDHYVDHLRTRLDEPADSVSKGGLPVTWDSVVGVLLYPARPHDADRVRLIEDVALEQALTVVWYDESNWRDSEATASRAIASPGLT